MPFASRSFFRRLTSAERSRTAILALGAALLVGWIRLLPLRLAPLDDYARMLSPASGRSSSSTAATGEQGREALAASLKSQLQYRGGDNRLHVFLGDADSYYWLRMARNLVRTGTVCDAIVDGRCWDSMAKAPLGRPNLLPHSLHVYAIAGLHRLLNLFVPGYPLAASSFLVPVLIGVLGVFPAFAIGTRFGGALGGFAAATIIGLNPLFLRRSIGSDNDVWNVVLPLFILWAVIKALEAERRATQISYALLAAILVGLHAGVWSGWIFTYYLVLLGLVATIILKVAYSLRWHRSRSLDGSGVRRAAIVAGTFCFAGILAVAAITGSVSSLASNPLNKLPVSAGGDASRDGTAMSLWPTIFTNNPSTNIEEMKSLGTAGIAEALGGRIYFLIGVLGVLVIVLPRSGWERWSFLVFGTGAVLDTLVVTVVHARPIVTLVVIAIPVAAAVVLSFFREASGASRWRGFEMTVALWFFAGMFLAAHGSRFVMILVPAFGFAFAASLGAAERAFAALKAWLKPSHAMLAKCVAPVALAAFITIVAYPIRDGYAEAHAYLPAMNVAWWAALSHIQERSPSDAIVVTWWDYGYWTEYLADRRVLADGGSLRSHIPYWMGKSLLAPTEEQSVGLLRMLECGSGATPESAGASHSGAFGKLRGHGLGDLAADDTVMALASLDRRDARAYLLRLGLNESAADDVLASTHCLPPPSYLVLTTTMNDMPAWRYAGNWDRRRALVARAREHIVGAAPSADLARQLGYSQEAARDLFEKARTLSSPDEIQNFIAPSDGYLSNRWLPCFSSSGVEAELDCPMEELRGVSLSPTLTLQAIVVHPGDPARARLRIRSDRADLGASHTDDIAPAAAIVAKGGRLDEVSDASSGSRDLAVLVDADRNRVLAGPRYLIRSTFTRLMFLNGEYSKYFEKVDDQRGYGGERVTTWRINWTGHDTTSASWALRRSSTADSTAIATPSRNRTATSQR
ncbi:MAG TPA: STT3 domain-containing protein [Candidatus Binataceae bacterium]